MTYDLLETSQSSEKSTSCVIVTESELHDTLIFIKLCET